MRLSIYTQESTDYNEKGDNQKQANYNIEVDISKISSYGETYEEALAKVKTQLINHLEEVEQAIKDIDTKLTSLHSLPIDYNLPNLAEVEPNSEGTQPLRETKQGSPMPASEIEFLKEIGIDYIQLQSNYQKSQQTYPESAQPPKTTTSPQPPTEPAQDNTIYNIAQKDYKPLVEAYQQAQHELTKRQSAIEGIKTSLEVQQVILKNTIANENDEETCMDKFSSIENLATYLLAFNQSLIQQLDIVLNKPLEEIQKDVNTLLRHKALRYRNKSDK